MKRIRFLGVALAGANTHKGHLPRLAKMHGALNALLGEDRRAAEAETEAEDSRIEKDSFSCTRL